MPRAEQVPDWSEGLSEAPRRATNGAVITLCPCCPTDSSAVTHISLTQRTQSHTCCLLVSTTQQFVLSWSRDQRGFEGTTVSDRLSMVIPAGCRIRGSSEDKWSRSSFTACDQRFDPTTPKGHEWQHHREVLWATQHFTGPRCEKCSKLHRQCFVLGLWDHLVRGTFEFLSYYDCLFPLKEEERRRRSEWKRWRISFSFYFFCCWRGKKAFKLFSYYYIVKRQNMGDKVFICVHACTVIVVFVAFIEYFLVQ